MSTLFMLFSIIVFAIGIVLVVKHKDGGWMSPAVLTGIALILIELPSILALVDM